MRALSRPAVLAGLVLLLPGCSAVQARAPEQLVWRTSAAQAMSDVRSAPAVDETCRQPVRLSVGGSRLRLRLSNVLSPTPLAVSAVTVGIRSAGAAARPGTLRPVAVAGSGAFVVRPGGQVTTDPVDLRTRPGDDLLVSFAVAGTAQLSEHRYGAATGWCSGPGTGDLTQDAGGAAFVGGTREGLVVEDVAVAVPRSSPPAVVAVGDSLTDAPLPQDTYPRWTDVAAARLRGTPVANAAIAGNFVTLEGGYGPRLVERFERDVLERSGAGTVVLLAGTNDLSRGIGAPTLTHELGRLAAAARSRGLGVVLVTVPPAVGRTTSERAARHEVNAWIRARSGSDVVVDADALLRDDRVPERLAAVYDRGDGLHLSPAGQRVLGEAVAAAL